MPVSSTSTDSTVSPHPSRPAVRSLTVPPPLSTRKRGPAASCRGPLR
jgi:hypothetical protein